MTAGRSRDETFPTCVPDDVADILRDHWAIVHLQRGLMVKVFARHDLHPGQVMCLRMLLHHGEMSQRELAEHVVLSRASVTRVLQKLERAGLVTRRPAADDARLTLVALTEAGHALQEGLDQAVGEYAAHSLAKLDDDDRADLARILHLWRTLAEDAVP